ncbi:AT-rich interaction domain 4B [Phyllostomus discolor]|uniref:AT-rich interaction domain 4B n=1 Tax=Phyllostomus discolor TaxID=89673 RepID=A0A833YBK2_9CHIR|nr:AT-rich interaction domain 4B [Phyllostomus discolor]
MGFKLLKVLLKTVSRRMKRGCTTQAVTAKRNVRPII